MCHSKDEFSNREVTSRVREKSGVDISIPLTRRRKTKSFFLYSPCCEEEREASIGKVWNQLEREREREQSGGRGRRKNCGICRQGLCIERYTQTQTHHAAPSIDELQLPACNKLLRELLGLRAILPPSPEELCLDVGELSVGVEGKLADGAVDYGLHRRILNGAIAAVEILVDCLEPACIVDEDGRVGVCLIPREERGESRAVVVAVKRS